MRNIVELVNYKNHDGTLINIKFYLDKDSIVKYDYINMVKFFNQMAILSKHVDQVTLNLLHGLALEELMRVQTFTKYEGLYILKDFTEVK